MPENIPKMTYRRRRLVIAGALLIVASATSFCCWRPSDKRLVGKWRVVQPVAYFDTSPRQQTIEFLANGTGHETFDGKPLYGPFRWHISEGGSLVLSYRRFGFHRIVAQIEDSIARIQGRRMPNSTSQRIEELTYGRLTLAKNRYFNQVMFERIAD